VAVEEEVGNMQLSLIIITLNEEKYVYKLLDCLKEQTYKDFEVVVVDGKSEDNTVAVVKNYKDYLDINIVETNKRGTGYQRNLGAKNSKYKNMIFMDADIVFENDHLEKVVSKVKNKNLDCAATFYEPIEDDKFYKLAFLIYNNYIYSLQKVFGLSAGAFLYVNKDALEKLGGFSETLVYAEDREFVRRLFKAGYEFAVLKTPSVKVSFRRFEKEGKTKIITTVLFAEIKQLIGKRFEDENDLNYKFGHYDDTE